jgi:hypothetical protein
MPPKRELRSKRKRTVDATSTEEPESQPQPPVKRQKRSSPARSETPPEFWDKLSRVPLCRRALREFYRRAVQPVVPEQRVKRDVADNLVKQLKRFARRGGPDLRMIRGVSPVHAGEDYVDFYSTQSRNHKIRWARSVLDPADPADPASLVLETRLRSRLRIRPKMPPSNRNLLTMESIRTTEVQNRITGKRYRSD